MEGRIMTKAKIRSIRRELKTWNPNRDYDSYTDDELIEYMADTLIGHICNVVIFDCGTTYVKDKLPIIGEE